MAGKKPLQQEMVQVERSESASPFWRTKSPSTRREVLKGTDSPLVVGASYSHADMLNFNTFSISASYPKHQAPPQASQKSRNISQPNAGKGASFKISPSSQPYSEFLSNKNEDWDLDDDEEPGMEYGYDDEDEDEFGLPSVANIRRKNKRQSTRQARDLAARRQGAGTLDLSRRVRSNSSDIAEERGQPNYPTAKKNEGKILRPQYKDILRDPANSLHLINYPPVPANSTSKETEAINSRISRINKFKRILQSSSISLLDLRNSAWSGVPEEVRAMTWQLLLGYLPTSSERRVTTLERKRKEYLDGVRQAFDRGKSTSNSSVATDDKKGLQNNSSATRARGLDESVWHQISIDVPRTNPHLPLYSFEATQRSLERILYVWAIRHPASGYVQGINDLVTPFFQVFLGSYITDPNIESGMDPGQLPKPVLDAVEADTFWCLTKLLDGIQDNYIFAQPGIQRQVGALRDLTMRIDSGLATHLQNEGVEFIQFSFRWMNCLLMREVSVRNTIRMWDTYLAEEQGFSEFHLYVCAAFLVKWSDKLVQMDFQEVMMFLQALPTKNWTEKDIEMLLSEAFIWQSLFRGSSAHLKGDGRLQS
ncbi:MAG: GTPase-activating protein [Trizodia sp. TS-e1964]|nr:MAG: GTPase-activating protein [Trizodia sp. TS-e1964]